MQKEKNQAPRPKPRRVKLPPVRSPVLLQGLANGLARADLCLHHRLRLPIASVSLGGHLVGSRKEEEREREESDKKEGFFIRRP